MKPSKVPLILLFFILLLFPAKPKIDQHTLQFLPSLYVYFPHKICWDKSAEINWWTQLEFKLREESV